MLSESLLVSSSWSSGINSTFHFTEFSEEMTTKTEKVENMQGRLRDVTDIELIERQFLKRVNKTPNITWLGKNWRRNNIAP